jgi:hypothetical protein
VGGRSCSTCGTHTGTHWPGCPNDVDSRGWSQPSAESAIVRRTDGEREAYLKGFEAGIEAREKHGTDVARELLTVIRDVG